MAQVFIAYARHNKQLVEALDRRLTQAGFSVFWDNRIFGGEEFNKRLEEEIANAKAVVGIIDAKSADSRWLTQECERAANNSKLVPLIVDGSLRQNLPLNVGALHCLEYPPDAAEEEFLALVKAINRLVAPEVVRRALANEPGAENARPLIAESTSAEATNVSTILGDLTAGKLRVPDYQRESEQWDPITKSLFIESVINNLAIPAFFFEPVNENGRIINYIVDGQQRLTTLASYYAGDFELLGPGEAPYISPVSKLYAGRKYDELPRVYQDSFNSYRLTIISLRDLGAQRLEVFRRINHGGTPLSAQDIRLAYYGERSPSVTFIRIVGVTAPHAPSSRSLLAKAQDKFQLAYPWQDDKVQQKWREFWSDQKAARGQAASDMFLCALIAADFDNLVNLADSNPAQLDVLKILEVRTVEDALDLYCAQLAHQESMGDRPLLAEHTVLVNQVFPMFEDFVRHLFGEQHIAPMRARLLGFCAGTLVRMGVSPATVANDFWRKMPELIWRTRNVAEKHKIAWQENKGRWSGTKSLKAQVIAIQQLMQALRPNRRS